MLPHAKPQPAPPSKISDAPKESVVWLWWHELRTALLGLCRSPRYSVPALLSLGLSIGAATGVFSVFSAQLLRPLPFPREEELVEVGLAGVSAADGRSKTLSVPFADEYRELHSVFESLAVQRSGGARLTGTGDAKQIPLQLTSLDFFDTLGAEAKLGRTYSARGPLPDGSGGVVLRHGFWLDAFGGAPVVGKTVLVDDVPKTVLGIISDDQARPSWASMWMPDEDPPRIRFGLWFTGVGRLAKGVSLELARERLHELSAAQQIQNGDGAVVTGTLTSLRDVIVGAQRGSLTLMLTAVLAFLLLACANVTALLGTRASVRQREYAIRTALGASRWTLARQSALEGLILAVLGGALGLGLASACMAVANQYEYSDVMGNTPARLDARVLCAFAGLVLLATAAATLAPVWHTRRAQPMDALRGEGRSSQNRRARRLRELLVMLQVAATLALLVNAALLVRSVRALLAVDTGVDIDGVVIGSVLSPTIKRGPGAEGYGVQRADAARTAERVLNRLRELPGVSHACVAAEVPFDFLDSVQMMEPEVAAGRPPLLVHPHSISPGCLETFGIQLLSGRDFNLGDTAERAVAIVNRAFARQLLGVEDAVGHQFRVVLPPDVRGQISLPWIDIIGMSEDTLEMDLTQAFEPAVYVSFLMNPLGHSTDSSVKFAVAVKTSGDPAALVPVLPRVIAEVAPNAPVSDVDPLRKYVAHTFRERTMLEHVLSAFGISSILLAAIGLFGVTGYTVAERSAEIGIRRALGASRGQILRMILWETGGVVLLGLALGGVLSWLAQSSLEAFLFGISATDAATYAGACLGMLLMAALAAWLPARTAAGISPSRALAGR